MANTLDSWYSRRNQPATAKVQQQPSGLLTSVTNWQNSPDQSVAGQLQAITSQDSPLMQLARTEGNQQAQQRGLLNSSLGIQSAQDAVLRNALPVAQADAAQAARVKGYNVDTLNKADQFNMQNAQQTKERIANNAYDKEKLGLINTYDWKKTNAGFAQDKAMENLKNQYDFSKTQYTTKADHDIKTRDLYTQLAKSYSDNIASINKDPNMTQQAKDYAVYQNYTDMRNQIQLLNAVGKIPNVADLLKPMKAPSKPDAAYYNTKLADQARTLAAQYQAQAGGGGGKVICTRLFELDLMDARTYAADQLYGELRYHENPDFMAWYHSWAKPLVNRMHGNSGASRLLIKTVSTIAKPWAKQMAFEMGQAGTGSVVGRLLMGIGQLAYFFSGKQGECEYVATH